MSFGILSVIVLAGLAGPLLSASDRVLVPVIVGELLAGLVVGSSVSAGFIRTIRRRRSSPRSASRC